MHRHKMNLLYSFGVLVAGLSGCRHANHESRGFAATPSTGAPSPTSPENPIVIGGSAAESLHRLLEEGQSSKFTIGFFLECEQSLNAGGVAQGGTPSARCTVQNMSGQQLNYTGEDALQLHISLENGENAKRVVAAFVKCAQRIEASGATSNGQLLAECTLWKSSSHNIVTADGAVAEEVHKNLELGASKEKTLGAFMRCEQMFVRSSTAPAAQGGALSTVCKFSDLPAKNQFHLAEKNSENVHKILGGGPSIKRTTASVFKCQQKINSSGIALGGDLAVTCSFISVSSENIVEITDAVAEMLHVKLEVGSSSKETMGVFLQCRQTISTSNPADLGGPSSTTCEFYDLPIENRLNIFGSSADELHQSLVANGNAKVTNSPFFTCSQQLQATGTAAGGTSGAGGGGDLETTCYLIK